MTLAVEPSSYMTEAFVPVIGFDLYHLNLHQQAKQKTENTSLDKFQHKLPHYKQDTIGFQFKKSTAGQSDMV